LCRPEADEVTARDDLPHNMIGKVLRRLLRDEAAAEHSVS
jgi:acyl-coenzyme A synthetase/AMP-(fatty) acid ligase